MNIRNMIVQDYNVVDQLMQQLHNIHVKGRPDLYVDLEHPYSLEEFRQKIEDDNCISILAEENWNVLGAKRLDLMVWDFNKSAIDFYKSLGMAEQRYILEKEL